MTRAPKFHFLMRDLALELDAERMTELEAAGRVAQHIQQTLKCVHVTFWSVSGELGQRVMRSVAAYDGTRHRVVAGAAAFPEAGGGFFGALVQAGCYVCEDTFAAPALQGVRQTMLVPFNIRALLAASYGGNGEVWGVVTCTSDVVRKWKASEVSALRKCAAEISGLRARRRALGNWLATGSLRG
ncbi:GAF domain-containing protein [Ideonella sp.]|uniref:GAF domain-containing protein n=1 Tax=Ideonella sp. TaxID=1929293 RepID=UPI002B486AF9|nr:GAF domain-containing protein [Ideonella sp.]HJV71670.1 GAF domain-containing protein [Ideonella sp.]